MFSSESPDRGDSNKHTQYRRCVVCSHKNRLTEAILMKHTIYHFQYKKKITLNYPKSAAMEFFHRDSRKSS